MGLFPHRDRYRNFRLRSTVSASSVRDACVTLTFTGIVAAAQVAQAVTIADNNAARLNVKQDPIQLSVTHYLKADIDNGPASIAVSTASFMAGLPIYRGESTALMVNAQYS